MQAALVSKLGKSFDIVDAEIDEPREREVLVRIRGVGICHTDIAAAEQQLPFQLPAVLGHEGAGIVERVGSGVTKVAPGDHVVLTFSSCGRCPNCSRGQPAYCAEFGALNGIGRRADGSSAVHVAGAPVSSFFFGQSSFAQYALTGERNVVAIDRRVPLELMGPLGCGIQTGAGAIMRAMDVGEGASLLVTGGGAVGLSAVMAAAVRKCAVVIVSEPHPGRRALALTLGATHAIDPLGGDLAETVRGIIAAGVDYALDTSGRAEVISASADCLATLGTLGLVGVPADPTSLFASNLLGLIGRGITVRGIIEGDSDPDTFIPELVKLYHAGQFPLDKLCATYPLDAINHAVADQLGGRCVKPILLPEAMA